VVAIDGARISGAGGGSGGTAGQSRGRSSVDRPRGTYDGVRPTAPRDVDASDSRAAGIGPGDGWSVARFGSRRSVSPAIRCLAGSESPHFGIPTVVATAADPAEIGCT
jgi:hypothetical protein